MFFFLQPPPAQSMVQALELLYALGGTPIIIMFLWSVLIGTISKVVFTLELLVSLGTGLVLSIYNPLIDTSFMEKRRWDHNEIIVHEVQSWPWINKACQYIKSF